jgi:alpha-ribazole phosphatase
MKLILVRHAEVSDAARGRCYGRFDIPLSEVGRTQCEALAGRLSTENVEVVLSSPSMRARETAEAIARPHGLDISVLDELSEVDFGAFEGLTYDEIAAAWPDVYAEWMAEPAVVRFPGGETLADLKRRVVGAVQRLRADHEEHLVVAVTHGGVVRAVLAEALGLSDDQAFRIAIETASMTRVEWQDGTTIVRGVNVSARG